MKAPAASLIAATTSGGMREPPSFVSVAAALITGRISSSSYSTWILLPLARTEQRWRGITKTRLGNLPDARPGFDAQISGHPGVNGVAISAALEGQRARLHRSTKCVSEWRQP